MGFFVFNQITKEASLLADALLDAETRIGELLKTIPKASGNHSEINHVDNFTPKQDVVKDMGFSNKQVSQFQRLADNKEIVEQVNNMGFLKSFLIVLANNSELKSLFIYHTNVWLLS